MSIFVAVLCVFAVGAGIWAWWLENGGSDKKQKENKSDEENAEE